MRCIETKGNRMNYIELERRETKDRVLHWVYVWTLGLALIPTVVIAGQALRLVVLVLAGVEP